MKKCIAIFTSLIISTAFFAGCSDNSDSFESKKYSTEAEKISDVNIEVRDKEIEVLISDDDKIHIDYSESSNEYYNISVTNDNVLTMTSEYDKEWNDFIGRKTEDKNRKISLQLPDNILSSLKLTTTNENITLCAFTVTDNISLSTNNGNIDFDDLNAGKELKLESKNGNINGTVVGGYDDYSISCKIKKGDTNLPERKESGEKTLNVTVNNGDAEIDFSNK